MRNDFLFPQFNLLNYSISFIFISSTFPPRIPSGIKLFVASLYTSYRETSCNINNIPKGEWLFTFTLLLEYYLCHLLLCSRYSLNKAWVPLFSSPRSASLSYKVFANSKPGVSKPICCAESKAIVISLIKCLT